MRSVAHVFVGEHNKNMNEDRFILSTAKMSQDKVYADARGGSQFATEGASNKSGIAENGDFRFIR